MNNRETLDQLFASGGIDLRRSALFDTDPGPQPADMDWDRVEGMLLGVAIGDALGKLTESMLPEERTDFYGEIRDYLPVDFEGGRRVGVPSDDSQMTFWTLEQMLEDGGFVPERVMARFASGCIYGIGDTVKGALQAFREGTPWYACGRRSIGNGALMRIAPMLLPHLRTGTRDLWVDTALSAVMTHNDSGSTAACLAWVAMLWDLLQMASPPEQEWWVSAYVKVARELELGQYKPRGGVFVGWRGPIWCFVDEKVPAARDRELPVVAACNEWYSGALLLETVPSVLYLLMRHAGDPEEAIVRAVNDTKDNDTVAAIVGAAVGALHGASGLPARWREGLTGRTTATDDGKVFRLINQARATWWG